MYTAAAYRQVQPLYVQDFYSTFPEVAPVYLYFVKLYCILLKIVKLRLPRNGWRGEIFAMNPDMTQLFYRHI